MTLPFKALADRSMLVLRFRLLVVWVVEEDIFLKLFISSTLLTLG